MQFIQGWNLVVEHVERRNLTIRTQEPLIIHSHWGPSGTPSCEVQRYKHNVSIGFIKNPKTVRICHVSRLRCPHASFMPLAFLSLTAHLSKSLGAETNQPTPPHTPPLPRNPWNRLGPRFWRNSILSQPSKQWSGILPSILRNFI